MKKSAIYEKAIQGVLVQWHRKNAEDLYPFSDLCDALEELLPRWRWALNDEQEQKEAQQ